MLLQNTSSGHLVEPKKQMWKNNKKNVRPRSTDRGERKSDLLLLIGPKDENAEEDANGSQTLSVSDRADIDQNQAMYMYISPVKREANSEDSSQDVVISKERLRQLAIEENEKRKITGIFKGG